MTNEQRKYLKQRFGEAARLLRDRSRRKCDRKDTPAVKAARRVIEKHNAEYRRNYKVTMNKVDRMIAQHQEALLFHDAAKALEAVKKIEKLAREA